MLHVPAQSPLQSYHNDHTNFGAPVCNPRNTKINDLRLWSQLLQLLQSGADYILLFGNPDSMPNPECLICRSPVLPREDLKVARW